MIKHPLTPTEVSEVAGRFFSLRELRGVRDPLTPPDTALTRDLTHA